MDAEKISKINALAKSLNDSHLVANIDEGVEKAKEVLGFQDVVMGNAPEEAAPKEAKPEKPENELKTVNELFKDEQTSANLAEEAKEDLTEIKKEFKEEETAELEEEKDIEEIEEEIDKGQEEIDEIKAEIEETGEHPISHAAEEEKGAAEIAREEE